MALHAVLLKESGNLSRVSDRRILARLLQTADITAYRCGAGLPYGSSGQQVIQGVTEVLLLWPITADADAVLIVNPSGVPEFPLLV